MINFWNFRVSDILFNFVKNFEIFRRFFQHLLEPLSCFASFIDLFKEL